MPDGSLPELARSLRALGAARDPATAAAHDAIFAPLIAARVRAAHAEGRDVVHSFHPSALLEAIDRAVSSAASNGTDNAAVARARSASARDAIDPLRLALEALAAPAEAAALAGPASREWEAWIATLRRAFTAADEACGRLARVLAEPAPRDGDASWFRRRGR
jgi:hypothetical protein